MTATKSRPRKAKIIQMPGVAIGQSIGPCKEVIECLTERLAEAKRGEIIAIAYATVQGNGGTGNGWVGSMVEGTMMIGSVERLRHRLLRADEE